jgi:Tn3 transposase DDE domain
MEPMFFSRGSSRNPSSSVNANPTTLINFALFDLVGKVLSPRIRDLGKITLCRDNTPTELAKLYPHAGPLLGTRWNEDLVADCWPGLLRMAGSLKYGQATASLIVGKWSAASRQNTLAAALTEWGMLRRTIHVAQYLSDPAYRRKIARQLNKGESLHALRRELHYAHQGTIGKPHLADQTEQAWCLTVLTNAVITWTTEYCQLAVRQLRAAGRAVPCRMRSWPTSPRRTARTSTSSASSSWTSKPSSPSSTPPAGARCARPPRWICGDKRGDTGAMTLAWSSARRSRRRAGGRYQTPETSKTFVF